MILIFGHVWIGHTEHFIPNGIWNSVARCNPTWLLKNIDRGMFTKTEDEISQPLSLHLTEKRRHLNLSFNGWTGGDRECLWWSIWMHRYRQKKEEELECWANLAVVRTELKKLLIGRVSIDRMDKMMCRVDQVTSSLIKALHSNLPTALPEH